MTQKKEYGILSLPVIVGALGFFVDVFDLLLFNIIRKPSLKSLGLDDNSIDATGEYMLNIQMIGLVIGGVLWGILGDKKGRLSVLFGSILLYSIATIANGFVQDVTTYTWLRFIAGLGLAGELGASITLTSEILPKEKRGIAATIIATTGVFGTITAFYVNDFFNNWRICFFIGGGLGLLLLLMRVSIKESGMYDSVKNKSVQLGNFFMFFTKKDRFYKYIRSILIGLPVWYAIGVLVSFSNKFGKGMGIENVDPGRAVMYQYMGLALGDLSAGFLSNIIKSRKKALFVFYSIAIIFMVLYFMQHNETAQHMYWICMGLGFGSGISVLYISMSAEQFGTNLRSTATTSIPNFVRGGLVLISLLFQWIRSLNGIDFVTGGWITGIIVMVIALIAVFYTKETFGKDLDFIET
jgi:putative MFS transporter